MAALHVDEVLSDSDALQEQFQVQCRRGEVGRLVPS